MTLLPAEDKSARKHSADSEFIFYKIKKIQNPLISSTSRFADFF